MKNIFKTTFLSILFLSVFSCDKNELDKDPVVNANGFIAYKLPDATAPSVIIDPADATLFGKYNWDVSNNGPSSVSTYELVVFDHDNDPNLKNEVAYVGSGVQVTATMRKAEITIKEFNDLINKLPTFKCSQMSIDVRIKSTLGLASTNGFVQYSNPINYQVTGFSTQKKQIAFATDVASASTSQKIVSSSYSSNTDFEGYLELKEGTYKLFVADACGDFSAGTALGASSATTLDPAAAGITITATTEGHYLLKANLATNTYSLKQYTTFGVFGTATRTGPGNAFQVPFVYNEVSKVWEKEMDLVTGYKFKFKSNIYTGALVAGTNGNPDYAPNSASASTQISVLGKNATPFGLEESSTATDITIPSNPDAVKETYTITLDVSKPRNYSYTLTKK